MSAEVLERLDDPETDNTTFKGPAPSRPPALTELIGKEIGNRILLVKPEFSKGKPGACTTAKAGSRCDHQHHRKKAGADPGRSVPPWARPIARRTQWVTVTGCRLRPPGRAHQRACAWKI
jgi:hypothetical protein